MCPPEHDQTVATKRAHALQRTPDQEAQAWDGDSQALARLRQTTGNAGLLHLLARHQPSVPRLTTVTSGTRAALPALTTVQPTSVQREEQDAAAREAGRKERAARREALAARREKVEARKQARAARLAGGDAPAAPQGPVAVAGPQAAAGPVPAAGAPAQAPAGGGAESMAAKLAKWAELQNKRQADIAATAPAATLGPAAPAAAAPAPKARNEPNHQMAAEQLSNLTRRLGQVAQPVTDQSLHGARDKNAFRLVAEKNGLGNELSSIVRSYRAGETTDAQFQSQLGAWQTKMSAYEQKVLAYKPPAVTSRPQGNDSAADMTEAAERRRRQEARWARKNR